MSRKAWRCKRTFHRNRMTWQGSDTCMCQQDTENSCLNSTPSQYNIFRQYNLCIAEIHPQMSTCLQSNLYNPICWSFPDHSDMSQQHTTGKQCFLVDLSTHLTGTKYKQSLFQHKKLQVETFSAYFFLRLKFASKTIK